MFNNHFDNTDFMVVFSQRILSTIGAERSTGCRAVPHSLKFTRFGGHLSFSQEVFPMPNPRSLHPPEFKRQMVDLVRSGRSPEQLALEFATTANAIRN